MTPDPKWLEIVKDNDERLAIAAACGLFLLANRWGWLPPLADWVLPTVWLGFLVFACLAGVKFLNIALLGVEVLFIWIGRTKK